MARSNYLLGRWRTRQAVKIRSRVGHAHGREVVLSAYPCQGGMRYAFAELEGPPSPNVLYRIRVTVKRAAIYANREFYPEGK